jgi:hypothetical protein
VFDVLADDLNSLLIEERQRCDALANDNDTMLRLLEETRAQKLQIENDFKEDIKIKDKQIKEFNLQINFLQDQLENEV